MVVIDMRDLPALPADTLICAGDTVRLLAPLPGTYSWSTGAASSSISPTTAGRYELTVTNGCGDFYFDSQVQTYDCDCRVYVPNAFSPNADGENDALDISVGCDFPHQFLRFQVFDRWGTLLFSTADPLGAAWDGTSNGRALPPGMYTWTLAYDYQRKGKNQAVLKSGDVAIIR
jgi:gliding motility-associated-like protein